MDAIAAVILGGTSFVGGIGTVFETSSHVTVVPKGKLGFTKGVLVRDLDGHATLLLQE